MCVFYLSLVLRCLRMLSVSLLSIGFLLLCFIRRRLEDFRRCIGSNQYRLGDWPVESYLPVHTSIAVNIRPSIQSLIHQSSADLQLRLGLHQQKDVTSAYPSRRNLCFRNRKIVWCQHYVQPPSCRTRYFD